MDSTLLTDPNFVIKLGKELQKRIGILPLVEVHAFHLESQPGEVIRMLRVQPQSFSEISRVVRASRTMKLTVRACGERTGGDSGIYGTPSTVLVDCSLLADSPRMEFVNIQRKGDQNITRGLRVLACVGITELVQFQIRSQIEVAQAVETATIWGTVVGAITASVPGLVGPKGKARGACLSDEVISIRIVDSHGDLIQYSSDDELNSALSTLGLLGVVYDVTLRYSPMSLTKVNFKFLKWEELLNLKTEILRNSVTFDDFTELIYLPYNSCKLTDQEVSDISGWKAEQDDVIMRTGRRCTQPKGPNSPDGINGDSFQRQSIYLLDQVFGPETKHFVNNVMKTPWLLNRAHHHLRCRFQPEPTCIQYTPWAINSLGKMSDPLRILRFTLESTHELTMFPHAMKAIFQLLEDLSHGGPRYRKNYAINLGVRVHFTGSTRTGRLLGVGFEPDKTDASNTVLIHITLAGITSPGPCAMWTRAANHATNLLLRSLPRCIPQWKTEWHGIEALKQRYKEFLGKQTDSLKELIAMADRDGVFLNELLASILYPEPTFYQKLYSTQRIDAISRVAEDLKCEVF